MELKNNPLKHQILKSKIAVLKQKLNEGGLTEAQVARINELIAEHEVEIAALEPKSKKKGLETETIKEN